MDHGLIEGLVGIGAILFSLWFFYDRWKNG